MPTEALVRAIDEAKRLSKRRRFTQSVDLIIGLRDVDLKRPENRIDEIVELPHSTGRGVRICVFASDALALRSREAGVDQVVEKDAISKLGADKRAAKRLAKEFDFFVAEGSLMPSIGRHLGSILGPRGKMPVPVAPTVDISEVVARLKRSVKLRARESPVIQCRIGSEDMSNAEIAENANAIFSRLERKLAKGMRNIEEAYVKCTMGPPVEIEIER